MEHERHLVDRAHVGRADHAVLVDVAEERDLLLDLPLERLRRAAEQDVGLDAEAGQLLHRVLRRLRLELARARDVRHERQVDVERVVGTELPAQLPDGLDEGQALDVADRAAHLGDADVEALGGLADAAFDLVGDVRDHLHGPAQVVAAALLGDDGVVHLAGREAVPPPEPRRHVALVVPEIEVGLGAVVGDEDLAVLERTHRAGVDVDVGVGLDDRDGEPARLEQRADRRRRDTLSQRRDDAARHEDELGLRGLLRHAVPPP